MNDWIISSEPKTLCYQICYDDTSLWAGVSYRKIGSLSSRSMSQQGLIWSKYDSFYNIFWTYDLSATKLGLILYYHNPEYLMKILNCCIQGQGHSKISKCQWIFVQMIFSESLNLLLPNLVWWCIIMSQIVFPKDCFMSSRSRSQGKLI